MSVFHPISGRLLFSSRRHLASSLLSRLLSSAPATATVFWRLLRSNSGNPSLERILSRSPSKVQLTASVVEAVLHQSTATAAATAAASDDDGDRTLALRFFVWAGLQPHHRHSAAAYAAACDALHLPRHPQFLSHLLDSYHAAASPVCVKTFKILLNLCRHSNLPDEAISLLRRMPEFDCRPDTSSYNVVLRLLADAGRGPAVESILKEMTAAGLIPDLITYVSAVRGLSASGEIEAARRLLGQMRSNGCVPNAVVYSALLDGACAYGDLKSAGEVMEEMEQSLDATCAPNVVSYTCLIKCLCQKGQLSDALGLLDRMGKRGCSPNQVTVRTLVDGFCARGHVEGAQELVESVAVEGKVSMEDCYSILAVCLLRSKSLEAAEDVLRRMLEKGVRPNGMACNSLLRELCEQRRFLDACSWRLEMEEKRLECIDSDVYSSLLLGLCNEGRVDEALRLGAKVVDMEVNLHGDCVDGVVQMLNKYGELGLATQIMKLKRPQQL